MLLEAPAISVTRDELITDQHEGIITNSSFVHFE